ncbi:hypothetical protein RZE82_07040 [Mollicutes bacterium LVI A0039]|nr:hypothetical protein RZE82_07040 [Mollicutes bacterium LVI A0039]
MSKLHLTDKELREVIHNMVNGYFSLNPKDPNNIGRMTNKIFDSILKTDSCKCIGGNKVEIVENDLELLILIAIDCEKSNIEYKGKLNNFLRTAKVCEKLGMSQNPIYLEYIEQLNCQSELQVALALGSMN